MARVISFHSFRRGTGKSCLAANIATLLAMAGQRVGLIDTNLQAPSLHVLFGAGDGEMGRHLNDFLFGSAGIEEASYDLTARLPSPVSGRLFLVPASTELRDVARIMREGYDAHLLEIAFERFAEQRLLDVLLVDTYAGLNETTLQAMALSDAVAILLHLDQQNYQGTSIMIEVARELNPARLTLVVNEAPPAFDPRAIEKQLAESYLCQVGAVLPYSDNLSSLSSASIFVMHYPHDAITAGLARLARELIRL
jgi:MinD-like ATPase involved in chromosome partitioning or flagellar assembly